MQFGFQNLNQYQIQLMQQYEAQIMQMNMNNMQAMNVQAMNGGMGYFVPFQAPQPMDSSVNSSSKLSQVSQSDTQSRAS